MKKVKLFIKNNHIELITFILYITLLLILNTFHEHWFDEVEAWFISTDCSLKTIFSEITHNEGHPPIWYLILKPLSVMGFSCDVGLCIANDVIMIIAMYLFLIYAPFKRWIKCVIPFTYFFFYQYGIICRPYCMMMLGFVLAAMYHKDRDAKPYRYIGALLIICSSSAYGIVLAAGITIAWIINILDFKNKKALIASLKSFVKMPAFCAMIILLAVNLVYMYLIIPKDDTIAVVMSSNESLIEKLLYTFFILPANGFFAFTYGRTYALEFSLSTITRLGDLFAGIVFMCMIAGFAWYNKKIKEFFIPFSLFAIFSAIVYFYTHHIGIYTIFIIYFLWCCIENDDKKTEQLNKLISKINKKHLNEITLILKAFCCIILGISVYWSVRASINDINYSYAVGEETADFIKANNIDNYRCMARWEHAGDYPGTDEDFVNLNGTGIASITALVYLDNNIFFNHNNGNDNLRYRQHKIDADICVYKEWAKDGLPDFIFGEDAPIEDVYEGKSILSDYTLIKIFYCDMCWKSERYRIVFPIYIRNDLMKEFPQFNNLGTIEEYR